MTTPRRLAAASRGGTEPDRGIRIGFGPRRFALSPLVAFGELTPGGISSQRAGTWVLRPQSRQH